MSFGAFALIGDCLRKTLPSGRESIEPISATLSAENATQASATSSGRSHRSALGGQSSECWWSKSLGEPFLIEVRRGLSESRPSRRDGERAQAASNCV